VRKVPPTQVVGTFRITPVDRLVVEKSLSPPGARHLSCQATG